MSYIVLARKWRPQSFEDLVGQSHVSITLANAIARDRVAHAFLFTGVRGVGKTTSARILAKALNCVQGPTATPCQKCSPCIDITAGNDVDVHEIDGASYNGVDEVRKLQESLPYRPQRDRFKIFIVDEVHMLSNAAWNAFLKTLEEPPPHVKFIFATTEVHKVPVTILSRCQRYDFKLLSAQTVAARLRWVLDQEGIPADDAAIATIAREAAGSMRDGMSLLDQVIAWVGTTGDKITAEGVAKVLGVADHLVLHRLASALVDGDPATCLGIVGDLAEQGYDLAHVARDILAHLRNLVVAKVCDDPAPLLDLADMEVADVKALASKASADDLSRLHQAFSKAFDDIVRGGQPRASLEMALVRLARRPPLLPIDDLLRRLDDLERRIRGDGSPGPSADRSPPRSPPFQPPERGGRSFASGQQPSPQQQPPPVPDKPSSPVPTPIEQPLSVKPSEQPQKPASLSSTTPQDHVELPQRSSQPSMASPNQVSTPHIPTAHVSTATLSVNDASSSRPSHQVPATPVQSTNAAQPLHRTIETQQPPLSDRLKAHHSAPTYAASQDKPPVVVATAEPQKSTSVVHGTSLDDWRAVIALVQKQRPALASVLEHAAVVEFSPTRVVIGYPAGSFLYAQATEPSSRELLGGALRAHVGHPTDLVFETLSQESNTVSVAQIHQAERKARLDAARQAVVDHPLVVAAIELLGAEIKDVRLPQDSLES